jgi:beta-galactosidase
MSIKIKIDCTKHFALLIAMVVWVLPVAVQAQRAESQRESISFNENWRFQRNDPTNAEGVLSYEKIKDWMRSTGNSFVLTSDAVKSRPVGNLGENVSYTKPKFDDSSWRQLNLPHDWAIEGDFVQELPGETGKRPFAGVGWYRKHFTLSPSDKGKHIYIDFDGAMSYSTVWINGQFVGGWPYGYASFRLDLTPYIEFGKENVLAVRLDNPPESSRWYPGAGIYRNVWLVKTPPVNVGQWGTYVTTPETGPESASVKIKTTVDNNSPVGVNATIKAQIFEIGVNGQKIGPAVVSSAAESISPAAKSSSTSETTLKVKNPKLWSLEKPSRYVVVIQVVRNGKIVDSYETPFGIRTIRFDAEKGFFLNGKHVYIKGVCNHHDLGALGTAINKRALERQVEILKEMGANAIRTSHNPPAPELLEICDRLGMLVMDEGFDAWAAAKEKNDYHLAFADWHEKDWRSQVRRDRNHPSVILWSIGNEIAEQRSPEGHKIAVALSQIAHEEDPTRPTAAGANHVVAGYNGFQKTVDVFGYNYKPGEYGKFRQANPAIPLFASETASTISSRGEYFFPVVDDKSKGLANFQMSSYDLYAPRWATPPDVEFEGQDRNPFVAGEFVWTGFDYLGEPTPYDNDSKNLLVFTDRNEQANKAEELKTLGKIRVPSRSSYFGIVDLCGFKKDRFYIYQARWRPDLPMAHILPHWNWSERLGQVTPVHVYTSGDEAELFLNGKSLGRKKREPFQYRLRWNDVVYQPGELKVIVYKDGKKWAEDIVKTTGTTAQILMKPDRSIIHSDGQDLSYITVKVADKDNLTVPRSKNRIQFEIAGPGEIVAVDNGDATDLESFQSRSRRAYNGLALVIVRSIKGKAGKITIKATSDGLKPAVVSVLSGK